MSLLRRILRAKLCPKAFIENISEFKPMQHLFTFAKKQQWTSDQLAGTFLVARGIRGREGVQVLLDFCQREDVALTWYDCIERFVVIFEAAWRDEVLRTQKASVRITRNDRTCLASGRVTGPYL